MFDSYIVPSDYYAWMLLAQCFSDNALKDDELLLGAQVYAAPGSLEIKIKLKDRKDMVAYRLKNNTDVKKRVT